MKFYSGDLPEALRVWSPATSIASKAGSPITSVTAGGTCKRRYGKTANWPTNGASAGTRSLTHVREL